MLSIYTSRHRSFDRLGKSDRESEHPVNCPLDYDTNMRRQSAANGGGREDHRDHEGRDRSGPHGMGRVSKCILPQSEYSDSRRLQDDSGNEPPIALSAASPILEPHLLPEFWGTC